MKTFISWLLLSASMMAQAQPANKSSAIRFEDATAKSGIQFIHNFGSQKLGSLLESTGAGCVWFDYNNDGFLDLYVLTGKPLESGIHPYPLKQPLATPPHNHLYRNNGDGTFTDVTDQAGVAANVYGMSQVKAVDANRAWFSTDKGLVYYDGTNFAIYRPSLDTHKPEMYITDAAGKLQKKVPVQTAPSHNYILGVDFQGDDIWVATAHAVPARARSLPVSTPTES